MFVTRLVSNPLTSSSSKPRQPLNIPLISVTRLVSNPLTSSSFKSIQPLNIPLMFVTWLVSNSLTSTSFKYLQPLNISLMSVTLLVSIFSSPDISVKSQQSKNKPLRLIPSLSNVIFPVILTFCMSLLILFHGAPLFSKLSATPPLIVSTPSLTSQVQVPHVPEVAASSLCVSIPCASAMRCNPDIGMVLTSIHAVHPMLTAFFHCFFINFPPFFCYYHVSAKLSYFTNVKPLLSYRKQIYLFPVFFLFYFFISIPHPSLPVHVSSVHSPPYLFFHLCSHLPLMYQQTHPYSPHICVPMPHLPC